MSANRECSLLAAVALLAAGGARAQGGPAEPQPGGTSAAPPEAAPAGPAEGRRELEEEIVVTGSRIRRKDLTTPAPVTVITREQIIASGIASVGEFLRTLPEHSGASMSRQVNNGGDGTTTVSLRGIGDYRTLVLLNGRRVAPGGTGANWAVDLGTIPSAAVERIEVLKDGASPIYGSDAIGGVVNVITRRGWTGTEAVAYAGTSARRDGSTADASVTTGLSAESGSLLLSAGYSKQRSIWAGNRDFSRYIFGYDATTGIVTRRGSGAIPRGRIYNDGVANGNALWNALVDAYGYDDLVWDPAAPAIPGFSNPGWRPYLGNALSESGGDGYNYQPDNYLLTPSQRLSLYGNGEVRLGDRARGFLEVAHVGRQSQQRLAPEPLFTDVEGVAVSAANRWNPFGRDLDPYATGVAVYRRLTELSNRTFTQNVDTFRVVGGVDGTLPGALGPLGGWFWEASLGHGRSQGTQVKMGYLRKSLLRAALGPSFQDASGWHCGTPATGAIPGCVPLNLFGGPGSITPDQVAGLTFEGTARGTNEMASFQANLAGDLFQLLGERPAGLSLGYEYRRLSGSFVPDPVTLAGDSSEEYVKQTRGGYDVHEVYAEVSLPIADGLPLAHTLEATASARAFRYSLFAADYTYKLGARWRPLRDVTLRGTWSTAFRAPSISALYEGQWLAGMNDSLDGQKDPCAGSTGGPGSAGWIDPASPLGVACGPAVNNGVAGPGYSVYVAGNSNLKPETARVLTAGVVLEPRFARNLTVTADYYDIAIDRAIHTVGDAYMLASCYPSAAGVAPRYCDLITRDPQTQAITRILDRRQNAWTERTSGVDLAVRHALPTTLGRFGLSLDGVWLERYDLVPPSGTVIRAKGTYDWGAHPAYRFNAGATWGLGGLAAGATARYIGSFHECGSPDGVFLYASGACYLDSTYAHRMPSYVTWDGFASYALGSSAGRTTAMVGMQNIFDARPPVIYTNGSYASDPGIYDFVGRFVYLRLTHRL